MRWPWRKRRSPGWAARREREIARLVDLTDKLLIALNVDPGAWRQLVEERDELRQKFKESLWHQEYLTDRIYRMEREVCPVCGVAVYPQPPAPPSKSDPDFDAAMRSAALEDQSKRKG